MPVGCSRPTFRGRRMTVAPLADAAQQTTRTRKAKAGYVSDTRVFPNQSTPRTRVVLKLSARRVSQALDHASYVGRLPHVLQVVRDHAHQSDANGDRRIPRGVDHALEVSVGEGG